MDLRAKLSLLSSRRLGPPGGPVRPGPAEAAASDAGARQPEIEALRGRLAELMARTRARREEKRAAREAEVEARLAAAPLPFDELETEDGPVHVRTLRHAAHDRVGQVAIAPGRTVPGEILSLLSLDPGLAGVDASRALYVDTETTGLAGGTGTVPFLVGLGFFDGEELVVEQLLLRRLGEEAPMLTRIAARVASSSLLVSFNGKAFDLPLLRTRFVMNRVPAPKEPPHFDLVHVARRVHRTGRGGANAHAAARTDGHGGGPWIEEVDESGDALRRRTSCKLVALERKLLGFGRVDDVPSGEVPARYGHFLRTGDADAIRAVCDHNAWDVVSMAALLGLYASAVASLDEGAPALLGGRDLVGLATTMRRFGDLRRARAAADAAVDASSGDETDGELQRLARRSRGGIAKQSRDVATALDDFEHLAREHDDAAARLDLAKLYEHAVKDPRRALAEVLRGTPEPPEASAHRRARLERKVDKVAERKPRRKRAGPS